MLLFIQQTLQMYKQHKLIQEFNLFLNLEIQHGNGPFGQLSLCRPAVSSYTLGATCRSQLIYKPVRLGNVGTQSKPTQRQGECTDNTRSRNRTRVSGTMRQQLY